MALTIYAKAGLLRLRPRTLPKAKAKDLKVARPRPQILALRPKAKD